MRYGSVGVLGLLLSIALAPGRAQAGDVPPGTTVEVLLSVSPTLSSVAREAFLEEASAIWQREGVTIDWLSGDTPRPPSTRRLRVLVIPRNTPGPRRERQTLIVGELVRSASGHAVALASVECAELIVQQATPGVLRLRQVDQRRVGLVLGRTIAHEIGHFLLGTVAHTATGLMRAHFDGREFADLASDSFALARTLE